MKIRVHAGDFVVEELLRDDVLRGAGGWSRARGFALYRLRKESLSTEEASRRLARAVGVDRALVAHAGLKDKHARTTQHVTVATSSKGGAPRIAGKGWEAELLGFVSEGAQAGWIRRNRFRLIVRGLDPHGAEQMDRNSGFLASGPGRLVVVNYFGEQRFGSARHGEGFAAPALVREDFERGLKLLIATPARKDTGERRERTRALAAHWGDWGRVLGMIGRHPERRAVEALAAGKGWREAFESLPYALRRMAVEAYQSHLWNAAAAEVGGRLAEGEAIVRGAMVFPAAGRVSGAWRTLEIPTAGPGTVLSAAWGGAVERELARDGLTLAGLKIPGVRRPEFGEVWRPLVVMAEGFEMGAAERDADGALMRRVRFDLARGAYATVVMRALGGEVTPWPAGPR